MEAKIKREKKVNGSSMLWLESIKQFIEQLGESEMETGSLYSISIESIHHYYMQSLKMNNENQENRRRRRI